MMDSVNKLESSGQTYQTNENVRDENYKGKLLFLMNYFVSFGTDCQSMIKNQYLMLISFMFYNKIRVLVCSVHCHIHFSSLVILVVFKMKLHPR